MEARRAPFPLPRFPGTLLLVCRTLRKHGFSCYIVGGALRNLALGTPPEDYDLATDAPPREVMKLFRRVIPTGIQHGTVTIVFRDHCYEVTTFRVETSYSDGRHPDEVRFTTSLEEDLSRRDFTINAMALDPLTGEFFDPFDGYSDIKRRLIKAIGNPEERFEEDALRILRAIRFATQLSFSIEQETYTAIGRHVEHLRRISWERIRDELSKIMEAVRPSRGFLQMEETGILSIVLPELEKCRGVLQSPPHRFDVLDHLLHTCDALPPSDPPLRWAGLLHDIGKPETLSEDDLGGIHFHRHEHVSSHLAQRILKRLKFPNAVIQDVSHLIRHHMFDYTPDWTDAAVRRFLHRTGPEYLERLIKLRIADRIGMTGETAPSHDLAGLKARAERLLAENTPLSIKDLAVDGHILQEDAGIPPGPWMGKTLRFLLDAVLEDPSQNTRARLTELARNFYTQRGKQHV
ncbi:polynucleotide adenylyltransferase/metal dependent phosphohydrolase [Spirochaeta thermophila DSM 6578]|uniref:Polynucleotide adenylyltransferase/metal dependent phosphohydrolase n=1 Tax=Winmispira thermophila (strain ATCC 700085 / DSM 6578 / Z-1203) TaxID=869211 RepID=G0GDM1_WINT7|nr:HD domain-containing protein [Spirochaeta thermophila]AEJ61368.1 polynucleotide adenylyltransferase/metal dependent phosphohydrolase [Spirochaeta thermophila DSM 6578]